MGVENNAEDMLKALSEQSSKKTPKKRGIAKILSICIVSMLFLGGLGYFIYQALPQNQAVAEKTKTEDVLGSKKSDMTGYAVLNLPKWAKTPYTLLSEEDIANMVKDQEDNFIGWTAQTLPSEADGFTPDPNEAYDEDGLPNDMYTNLTKENFVKAASMSIYRIINPVFGEWDVYQSPFGASATDAYINAYDDLASADYVENLINNPQAKSAIYMDINQDGYGGKLSYSTKNGQYNKFIGVIKNGDITFDHENNTVIVDIDVDYMLDAKRVFESRHLKLTFEEQFGQLMLVGGDVNVK